MLKFSFGFIVAMLISFVITGIYLGYYKSVDVQLGNTTELHLLGIPVTGPYHLANESIEKVEKWAKENNIDCPKSFGMYLDKPEHVEPEKLKSFVGCVLEDKTSLVIPETYEQKTIKSLKAYIANFKGSPALGPLKVYPDASEWFEKNKLQFKYSLEIYSLMDGSFQTQYIFPIPIEEVNPDKLRL